MNKTLDANRTLDRIVSAIGDLPATPAIISALTGLTSDVNSDVERITKAIQADQSLTAKVLKLSNSSFYGRAREVKTVKEAILILGFMTLHSLVIATATHSLYQKNARDKTVDKLWEHSLATAIACRLIAQTVMHPAVEEAFIGGLLHDIGKLVLAHKMTDYYRAIVQKVEETGGKFLEFEEAEFGFNHAMIGMLLLQKWSFPDLLCEAVLHHHEPSGANGGPAPLPYLINLGNFMAKKLAAGFNDFRVEDLSLLPSAMVLGLNGERLDALGVQLADHFETEKEIFRLKT